MQIAMGAKMTHQAMPLTLEGKAHRNGCSLLDRGAPADLADRARRWQCCGGGHSHTQCSPFLTSILIDLALRPPPAALRLVLVSPAHGFAAKFLRPQDLWQTPRASWTNGRASALMRLETQVRTLLAILKGFLKSWRQAYKTRVP
eukprot:2363911-Amphidinium_carterae.2